jgi:hypothetical protein
MSEPLILLALWLVPPPLATQADISRTAGDDPRSVVRQATRAVERDSIGYLAARWETRLRHDASDGAAAIGLATIARLTYDYPTAERLYRRLYTADSARPDP